ncbi:MAG TPA: BRCT domain-containing protein [Parvibaculum sp.]|uniref:BRCT domain-containing protein n=1 Tax=Parvibaculum sp. TaxID=2024848 RepID=UPI002B80255C|nr:BRCT domain-containing protein [Parvibaculum sp.]HMM13056.1 BRCT domain-containing protein [Parvibaculum sp.]
MHSDHRTYFRFTGRLRIEKSVNSLMGLVEGIAIDEMINGRELDFLHMWIDDHKFVEINHPFNEFIPVIRNVIREGVINDDEKNDILWLGERLCGTGYFEAVAADMQKLHAVLGGIIADGVVTEPELRGLSNWLSEHEHLKTLWPYDEVASLVTSVLIDGKIDEEEHRLLKNFFSGFVSVLDDRVIGQPLVFEGASLTGVCAVCPEIQFEDSIFCFTGASYKYSRGELEETVRRLGGEVALSVSRKVDYLIIGAEGNPCWAYACYGRKVEKAVQLRKEGFSLVIAHENDFHDAVADLS